VLAAVDDVAGEASQAEGQFSAEKEKCANENDKASEEEECAAEFAERIHNEIFGVEWFRTQENCILMNSSGAILSKIGRHKLR
jgi:hypothetical protein